MAVTVCSPRPRCRGLAHRTEELLAAHVPLTLLLDLTDPEGPRSAELLRDEAGSADWLGAR